MNRNKWILTILTVLLIGSGAGVLAKYKSVQRLGAPGVKTQPIPDSRNVEVILPEQVLDYTSELLPQSEIVTNVLPKDTCYGQRRYTAPDKFYVQANVVLMGADRTSLHKPQFCLTGAGWTINKTEVTSIRLERPAPYDLPVIKLTASGNFTQDGREISVSGIYVYWYVDDNSISADPTGSDRMWSIARSLLTTGILERWAYISYFAPCNPGQEEETYARLKQLIAASVPEFQIPAGNNVVARKP